MSKAEQQYDSSSISVLEGRDAVRKRPAMYIGSTGKSGYHHLVYEIVDNSIDEALAGHCKNIAVTLLPDGYVQVEDDGRGIPVGIHPVKKISAVEVVLTILHAGGKFGDNKAYSSTGGLHGVGSSVVNFLSEKFFVQVKREGFIWTQEYVKGVPTDRLKKGEPCKTTGTMVRFKPDIEVFKEFEKFDYDTLISRFHELGFLNPTVSFVITDKRVSPAKVEKFKHDDGLVGFVKEMNKGKKVLHDPASFEAVSGTTTASVAFQYNDKYQENVLSFVNSINTSEGGTHLVGFKTAYTRALNNYYLSDQFETKGKKVELIGDDFREGLSAVISIKMINPQFESQTKIKLGNSEIKGIVDKLVYEKVSVWLRKNPGPANFILQKALVAGRAREEARKAKELVQRKSAIDYFSSGLPGKLADCQSSNPDECELFLVEGESAGGTAKLGRNRKYQAILPLKGKVLNVEKTATSKSLVNAELKSISMAVGTGVLDQFALTKLRYNKIIIMTDADVDGSHIKVLLMTAFYKLMPELCKAGNLYAACPPLYLVTRRGRKTYLHADEDLERYRREEFGLVPDISEEEFKRREDSYKKQVTLQRFKGLGEMSAEQLWETTMNPENRRLKKLNIGDEKDLVDLIKMLMGNEIEARREFIMSHASQVQRLDI